MVIKEIAALLLLVITMATAVLSSPLSVMNESPRSKPHHTTR